jgi:hypothetical protein
MNEKATALASAVAWLAIDFPMKKTDCESG